MNILAISGSTRQKSTNTAFLAALRDAAPEGMTISVFSELSTLPVFSPDFEQEKTPAVVKAFIQTIAEADGLIISSPEYARAIPGGLKNAIDWLVSGEEIATKPVVIVHASHRGDDMLASLRLVLGTVTNQFGEQIFLRFPLMSKTPEEVRSFLTRDENTLKSSRFLDAFQIFIERPSS